MQARQSEFATLLSYLEVKASSHDLSVTLSLSNHTYQALQVEVLIFSADANTRDLCRIVGRARGSS